MASLEIHVPQWQFGRTGARKNPDRLVLDLDPGAGAGLPECAEVARYARAILGEMGLDPMPVTSGSKGIHLSRRSTESRPASRCQRLRTSSLECSRRITPTWSSAT